ncbi:MAG: hypothetical protein LBP34_00285 [Flavobacteriaceae bacterium]|jgi:hypothetical protein|nr:hypothetical protein [Flavobacteriaceae bacterium]
MKKVFTIIAVIAFLSNVMAQELKIKKGNIIIDDQTVATIKKESGRYNYTISDLSGALLYQAAIKSKTPKGRETSQLWIELTNRDNKVQEVTLKLKRFNINLEKRLVENLVEKKFLTSSGVEESLYNNANTDITDELDRILDDFEAAYAIEDKKAEEYKLVLGSPVGVFYQITSDFVLIGYMTGKSRPDPKNNEKVISEYFVYDTDKNPVAGLQFGSYDTGDELKPKYIKTFEDDQDHPIITKCRFYTLDKEPMANRMVKMLFAKGYLKKRTIK